LRIRRFQIESESLTAQLDRVDDRVEEVRHLMRRIPGDVLAEFWNQLDISTIYHDCALEGEVISPEELNSALDPRIVTDATNLALYTAIRNHKKSFRICRRRARQKKIVFNDEFFKSLHLLFSSAETEPSGDGFRRDIPLHRTYFHEINQARQIRENMTEMLAWLNEEAFTTSSHPLSFAARFHHRFMHIFPYPETSGKVGRAAMNVYLMRNGFLPAVIHSTERQRYYEAIRNSTNELCSLLIDSEAAALDSAARFLRRVAT